MVSFTPTGQNVVISHTVLLRLVLWISVLLFKKKKILFPPSFEPGTFCVLGERDNDYTTGTNWEPSPLPSGNIIPPSTLLWIWDWQQQHRGNQGSASPMELLNTCSATKNLDASVYIMHDVLCAQGSLFPVHRNTIHESIFIWQAWPMRVCERTVVCKTTVQLSAKRKSCSDVQICHQYEHLVSHAAQI